MTNKKIVITSEYIPLVQLLKYADLLGSGGEFKYFIEENEILYNGSPENRRKKKIYPGDKVQVLDYVLEVQSEN